MKSLIFFLVIILCGCENDELTEIKYNGTGGISCWVEGSVAYKHIINSTADEIKGHIENAENGLTILEIGFYDDNDYNDFSYLGEFVSLVAYNINLENLEKTTFFLADKKNNESYGIYINGRDFKTNAANKGELKILYFDQSKKIIGGTFWFDAVDNDNRMKIRDGRFDLSVNIKNVGKR